MITRHPYVYCMRSHPIPCTITKMDYFHDYAEEERERHVSQRSSAHREGSGMEMMLRVPAPQRQQGRRRSASIQPTKLNPPWRGFALTAAGSEQNLQRAWVREEEAHRRPARGSEPSSPRHGRIRGGSGHGALPCCGTPRPDPAGARVSSAERASALRCPWQWLLERRWGLGRGRRRRRWRRGWLGESWGEGGGRRENREVGIFFQRVEWGWIDGWMDFQFHFVSFEPKSNNISRHAVHVLGTN